MATITPVKLKSSMVSYDGGRTWVLTRQFYLLAYGENNGQFIDKTMEGRKFKLVEENDDEKN